MSCTCQGCGKQYKVDLVIPDELWEQIKPNGKSEGAGLLCGACIMSRIEEISDYDYWYLGKVPSNQSNVIDCQGRRLIVTLSKSLKNIKRISLCILHRLYRITHRIQF